MIKFISFLIIILFLGIGIYYIIYQNNDTSSKTLVVQYDFELLTDKLLGTENLNNSNPKRNQEPLNHFNTKEEVLMLHLDGAEESSEVFLKQENELLEEKLLLEEKKLQEEKNKNLEEQDLKNTLEKKKQSLEEQDLKNTLEKKKQPLDGGSKSIQNKTVQPKINNTIKTDKTVKVQVNGKAPVIYIVIDDVGQNMHQLEWFSGIKVPLTYAILPFQDNSVTSAVLLNKLGKEVILHMPMEPIAEGLSGVYRTTDPGKGAIYGYHTKEEAENKINQALDSIPHLKGVNNHMGSLITSSVPHMQTILKEVHYRQLYYLDSKTTPKTKVSEVASSLGMLFGSRDIFLDNSSNENDILNEIQKMKQVALYQGSVVAIGHIWSKPLSNVLKREIPKMQEEGYVFKFFSQSFKE